MPGGAAKLALPVLAAAQGAPVPARQRAMSTHSADLLLQQEVQTLLSSIDVKELDR